MSDIEKAVDQNKNPIGGESGQNRTNNSKHGMLYFLLVLNLVATATFGTLILTKPVNQGPGLQTTQSLPAGLTQDQVNETADLLVKAYNEKSLDALYAIFGEYAKTQVKKEEVGKILAGISNFGKITATTFLSSELTSTTDVGKWYQMKFSAMYESGSGTMGITFLDRSGKLEVVSYKFYVGN